MKLLKTLNSAADQLIARFQTFADDLDKRSKEGEFGKYPWQKDYGLWPWQRRRKDTQ